MPLTQAEFDARAASQRTQMQIDGGRNAALAGREFRSLLQIGLELADVQAINILTKANRSIPFPEPVPCPNCGGSGDYCGRCLTVGTVAAAPDPAKVKLAHAIARLEAHRRRNGHQPS
jgi:hypothetical protein